MANRTSSNRTSSTIHLYDSGEIPDVQKKAIKRGDSKVAVFAAIERDMSMQGNAAYKHNFMSVINDIGIRSPNLPYVMLQGYNSWIGKMMGPDGKQNTSKSFMNTQARKILVTSTDYLAKSPKDRTVSNAALFGIINNLSPDIFNMNPEEYEELESLQESLVWIDDLTRVGNTKDITGQSRIDAKKVIPIFTLLLKKCCQFWTDRKKEGLDLKNKDESFWEQQMKLEKPIITLATIIYAIDTFENREINKDSQKIPFLDEIKKHMSKTDLENFPKISGKVGKSLIRRPIIWMYSILFTLSKEIHDKPMNSLSRALLVLMEMTARGLGNDRNNFIMAVLLTARCSVLDWNSISLEVNTSSETDVIKEYLSWYDICSPIILEDGKITVSNPELLSQRRLITIDDSYLDKSSIRGKQKSNLEHLRKSAETYSIDISSWSEEEIAKSHSNGIKTKMFDKKSLGLPTYISWWFQHSKVESDYFDPYQDIVYEFLIKEEESKGYSKCNEEDLVKNRYNYWRKNFRMALIANETDDIIPEPSNKKRKRKYTTNKSNEENNKSEEEENEEQSEENEDNEKEQLNEGKKDMDIDEKESEENQPSDSTTIKKQKVTSEIVTLIRSDPLRKLTVGTTLKIKTIKEKKENKYIIEFEYLDRTNITTKKSATSTTTSSTTNKKSTNKSTTTTGTKKTNTKKMNDSKTKEKPKKKPSTTDFDIISKLNPRELTKEEIDEINKMVLAKKPIANSKKLTFIGVKKVYKGPYEPTSEKDVNILRLVLLATKRMRESLDDILSIPQEIVYDKENNKLYLESNNIATHAPCSWETKQTTLNTHGSAKVTIVEKTTMGIYLASKIVQDDFFSENVNKILHNFTCRYLLGYAGGNLAKIIVNEDGSKCYSLDIEDNRKTIPLITDDIKPTIKDLLFSTNKFPTKKDTAKFDELLYSNLKSIEQCLEIAENEDTSSIEEYAQFLDFTSKLTTKEQIIERIKTMRICMTQFALDYSKKNEGGSLEATSLE